MSLIPFRNPMFELFDDEFNKMLEQFRAKYPFKLDGFMPAVDVYEKGKNVIVEAPLAGVDPQDVEVSVDNSILTIRGKKEHKKEVEEKNYWHKEVRYGAFARSVHLPVKVLSDKAKAASENGVLKIILPKAGSGKKEKSIKISVKEDKASGRQKKSKK